MELFSNLIYEYKKGMRDLALFCCKCQDIEKYTNHLRKTNTQYLVFNSTAKFNIFFGNPDCLEIIKQFSSDKLDKLTPQEDFILGIMLGYSRNEQYKRFLSKINKKNNTVTFCKIN